MSAEKILIIGGGLCGSLLAIRMAQRGYNVLLIESRSDLRSADISAGRSINLALSDRGLKAMNMVGLSEKVNKLCIPMKGRLVHDTEGNTFLSSYSGREDEHINSISRGGLNGLLLTEAESYDNVEILFNHNCLDIDLETKKARFEKANENKIVELSGDAIFGTDGAGSILRQEYYKSNKFLFNFSRNFLKHGYKELTIPPSVNGDFRIEPEALHIWPRGGFMLIALPNLDRSFTVTLFLPFEEGVYNFKDLDTPEKVHAFFKEVFPDVTAHMPGFEDEFLSNPTGPLGTVKCEPWYYEGNTLLLGDAAHAIVPFYGQGMNASFEDVVVFDQVYEEFSGDWSKIFKEYEKKRKIDTDAIADLALDNFIEMRDHVANPIFQKKRRWEMELEKNFPDKYFSKYSQVTFNADIPYSEAMKIGRAQDKALIELISSNTIHDNHQIKDVFMLVESRTQRILDETKSGL